MGKYDFTRLRPVREHEKEALEYLEEVHAWMQEYGPAIKKCVEAGVSNVRIAYTVGKTETAIRMYRQRHGF